MTLPILLPVVLSVRMDINHILKKIAELSQNQAVYVQRMYEFDQKFYTRRMRILKVAERCLDSLTFPITFFMDGSINGPYSMMITRILRERDVCDRALSDTLTSYERDQCLGILKLIDSETRRNAKKRCRWKHHSQHHEWTAQRRASKQD